MSLRSLSLVSPALAAAFLLGCEPETPTGGGGSMTAPSGGSTSEAGSAEGGSALGAAAEANSGLDFEPQILVVSDAKATDTVVLNVPGMHCDVMCSPKVRKAIASVDGVVKVETQISTDEGERTAKIWTTEEFDKSKAIAAVEEVGYEVN
ncbi:heavy-metal-associated domain-containing protein [Stratiformator vulcanicus]|uniref:Heavy-metal-associated domain protein n=1 Tax=Stratiformator vulcanicus TaxID=2527980 RepID=A0A517R6W8_9PLAN|nr:heavy-metal-associated domain-containing protein [Stratiformator vulcanicus]QDT39592.1 Heavy-metal-associated domain protein [Stratiformator vulcanicus]